MLTASTQSLRRDPTGCRRPASSGVLSSTVSLPDRLARALRAAAGRDARDATPVGGGDVDEAWRVELDDGSRAFLETRPDAPRGEYTAEAGALRWLGEPDGGLGVPEVLGVAEGDAAPDGGGARLLALGWLEGPPGDPAELGRGLAAVHQAGASSFGAPTPLRMSPLTLPNEPRDNWHAFFAEQRLHAVSADPPADRGALCGGGRSPRSSASASGCRRRSAGAGPASARRPVERQRVVRPAQPYLIDPVAYGGRARGRSRDAAAVRLAGPGFLEAYEERAPLAAGRGQRVALWQLFPLLVHAALFGGGYGASAERRGTQLPQARR